MKHQLEVTAQGAAFFQLYDAVEMLLCATASPLLLAQLIRVTKRMRRQAWDYLCSTEKWNLAWLDRFCSALEPFPFVAQHHSVQLAHPVFLCLYGSFFLARDHTTQDSDYSVLILDEETVPTNTVYWTCFTCHGYAVVPFDFAARALLISLLRRETEQNRLAWTQEELFLL